MQLHRSREERSLGPAHRSPGGVCRGALSCVRGAPSAVRPVCGSCPGVVEGGPGSARPSTGSGRAARPASSLGRAGHLTDGGYESCAAQVSVISRTSIPAAGGAEHHALRHEQREIQVPARSIFGRRRNPLRRLPIISDHRPDQRARSSIQLPRLMLDGRHSAALPEASSSH